MLSPLVDNVEFSCTFVSEKQQSISKNLAKMKNLKIRNTEVQVEMSIGWKGYGQYSISAICFFGRQKKNISFHSTDSELYDNRNDDDISYDEYQEMLFNRVDTDLESDLNEVIANYEEEQLDNE